MNRIVGTGERVCVCEERGGKRQREKRGKR